MNIEKIAEDALEIAMFDINTIATRLRKSRIYTSINKLNFKRFKDRRIKKYKEGLDITLEISSRNITRKEFRELRYVIIVKFLSGLTSEQLNIHDIKFHFNDEEYEYYFSGTDEYDDKYFVMKIEVKVLNDKILKL